MMHDARSLVALLRDHFASHDRSIAFLFGAGTSSAVNCAVVDVSTGKPSTFRSLIPAVEGLTSECRDAVIEMGTKETAAWTKLGTECHDLGLDPNIESILSRIRTKLDAITGLDSINGLTRTEWEQVDGVVRRKIANLATPKKTPAILPHHNFTRWVRNTTRRQPVEVFTTNYDVLFESTFDQLRVPHFDGFVGSQYAYFSPESVENDAFLPSASWVRFWKLHGSVSWSVQAVGSEKRITRSAPIENGELILPSHRKYDESRKEPYRSLMDRLGRVLARPDSLLVTCGFSFSDQHINAIIIDAIEQHPKTHLIALSYSDIDENHPVSRWAGSHPNVVHVGPNAGVIVGRFGKWSASGKPDAQLQETTGGLLSPDPASPDCVRVHAGDFNILCDFLMSMGLTNGRPT